MQTDQIQNKILYNTGAPPKSAPLPDTDADFKQALSRQMERKADQPAPPAPEPAPRSQTQKQPPKQIQAAQPKPAQQARPAQQAQQAQQANKADKTEPASQTADGDTTAAQDACAAPETAATTPATSADAAAASTTAAADAAAAEAAAAAAAADPMASMLAMVAAYQQLTTGKADKADAGTAATATDSSATDAAALAALQGDATGKHAAAADLAAEAGQKGAGTSGLQQAHAEDADAALLAKLGSGAERTAATTDAKAEKFAAKLAEASTVPQPVLPQGAQALAATTQAANALAANQLQARVGSNAWEQQLGQKVVWMVAGGDQSASLTLNPPDLGPLQVVLSVSNDQATATFTAHQPETRQAIENALPKLREMMNEAGIQLGNASVSAGSQEQQQAFAEQARGASGGSRYGDSNATADDAPPQPVIRRAVLGAVDTFA